jgi:hypothetical protein
LAGFLQWLATVEEERTLTMEKPHANHALVHADQLPYTATADSVAAARAAQEREREEFTRRTGMRLDRNGHLRRSSLRIESMRSQQH